MFRGTHASSLNIITTFCACVSFRVGSCEAIAGLATGSRMVAVLPSGPRARPDPRGGIPSQARAAAEEARAGDRIPYPIPTEIISRRARGRHGAVKFRIPGNLFSHRYSRSAHLKTGTSWRVKPRPGQDKTSPVAGMLRRAVRIWTTTRELHRHGQFLSLAAGFRRRIEVADRITGGVCWRRTIRSSAHNLSP